MFSNPATAHAVRPLWGASAADAISFFAARARAGALLPLCLVWALALIMVGAGLGSYGILDNNEGLYSEIPREMLRSGDWQHWIIPHLNGLLYMEKPPLLYWLTALCFAIFGENETAARLVPALSSLACVGALLWFGARLGRARDGRVAALLFISGLGVTLMSRTLMFDMLLTASLTSALFSAYLFSTEGKLSCLRWAAVFLALAVLTKGLVALILFGLIMGSFSLVSATSGANFCARLKAYFDVKALLIFLAIAAPWHLIASYIEPNFAWFYFINEHVLRFLGQRLPHDYYAGSWWYYLPRMFLYLFPGSLLIPVLLFAKKKNRASVKIPTAHTKHKHLQWFLLLAWLLPLLFFSFSKAKANYYLIVVMPMAALQFSLALQQRRMTRSVRVAPGLILSAVLLLLAWGATELGESQLDAIQIGAWPASVFLAYALVAMACLSLLCSVLTWRYPRTGLLSYLLLPLAQLCLCLSLLQAAEPVLSTKGMASLLQEQHGERSVFLYRGYEEHSSLPFYLKKSLPLVDSRSSDLFWGNKLRVNDIVLSDHGFDGASDNGAIALLVQHADVHHFLLKDYSKKFSSIKKYSNATLFIN
ncbi:ArnT family glycosyltransferase [Undibacterium parvum]|nr:glycosyltransferase family 39 protein [Undibacterium parvum]